MKKITLQGIESYIQTHLVGAEDDGGVTFFFKDKEENYVSTYRSGLDLKEWGCITEEGDYNTDFETLENPNFKEICEELLHLYEEEYC